ncbi:hypothetical protein AGMMS4952_07530 [Spirochaetia bacterium]|nr:hypothetical protein AGMMS4952_07530 [Spirochaetia bacterium]
MVKGEVWWANLPTDPYGSEPGKRRPVLIIQNDAFNRSAIQTTLVSMLPKNYITNINASIQYIFDAEV